MTRTLRLELPEDVYRSLAKAAEKCGQPPEALALERLVAATPELEHGAVETPTAPLEADPLMAMAGVDDFEPVSVDEVVYRGFRGHPRSSCF